MKGNEKLLNSVLIGSKRKISEIQQFKQPNFESKKRKRNFHKCVLVKVFGEVNEIEVHKFLSDHIFPSFVINSHFSEDPSLSMFIVKFKTSLDQVSALQLSNSTIKGKKIEISTFQDNKTSDIPQERKLRTPMRQNNGNNAMKITPENIVKQKQTHTPKYQAINLKDREVTYVQDSDEEQEDDLLDASLLDGNFFSISKLPIKKEKEEQDDDDVKIISILNPTKKKKKKKKKKKNQRIRLSKFFAQNYEEEKKEKINKKPKKEKQEKKVEIIELSDSDEDINDEIIEISDSSSEEEVETEKQELKEEKKDSILENTSDFGTEKETKTVKTQIEMKKKEEHQDINADELKIDEMALEDSKLQETTDDEDDDITLLSDYADLNGLNEDDTSKDKKIEKDSVSVENVDQEVKKKEKTKKKKIPTSIEAIKESRRLATSISFDVPEEKEITLEKLQEEFAKLQQELRIPILSTPKKNPKTPNKLEKDETADENEKMEEVNDADDENVNPQKKLVVKTNLKLKLEIVFYDNFWKIKFKDHKANAFKEIEVTPSEATINADTFYRFIDYIEDNNFQVCQDSIGFEEIADVIEALKPSDIIFFQDSQQIGELESHLKKLDLKLKINCPNICMQQTEIDDNSIFKKALMSVFYDTFPFDMNIDGNSISGEFSGHLTNIRAKKNKHIDPENIPLFGNWKSSDGKLQYFGNFKDKKFHGEGELKTPDFVYKGIFKANVFDNEVILSYYKISDCIFRVKKDCVLNAGKENEMQVEAGLQYCGDFKDGVFDGYGYYSIVKPFSNHDRCHPKSIVKDTHIENHNVVEKGDGEFKNGKKHGVFQIRKQNYFRIGQWKNGILYNGYGQDFDKDEGMYSYAVIDYEVQKKAYSIPSNYYTKFDQEDTVQLKSDKKKAKKIVYNNYCFKSRLEAKWVFFFESIGIDYVYEPCSFPYIGNDKKIHKYTPDFYLPTFNFWIEIKGEYPNREAKEKVKKIVPIIKNQFGDRNRIFLYYGQLLPPAQIRNASANYGIEFTTDEIGTVITIPEVFWTHCPNPECNYYDIQKEFGPNEPRIRTCCGYVQTEEKSIPSFALKQHFKAANIKGGMFDTLVKTQKTRWREKKEKYMGTEFQIKTIKTSSYFLN